MQKYEQDKEELQQKLFDVQKRLEAEENAKMEYLTFSEEQVITIKSLRDENLKLKRQIEELRSDNRSKSKSEEERINSVVCSVAHR